jgi:predicted DNA-binding protein (MmcQ/YjbR family)
MTREELNRYCAALPQTTAVVQWGDADVWKIGGKVFAIVGWGEGQHLAVSFKVSDMVFEILRDHPDCRPAPYLASRGLKWIQYYRGDEMSDGDLCDTIAASYHLIAKALPKKTQKALGPLP